MSFKIAPVSEHERIAFKEGFGCGVFVSVLVGIVVGALWMLLTGSYWTH